MHPFLDVARALGLQAASRLMELRLRPLLKERKADRSLVTNADRESDDIIRSGLQRVFPDHAILTEESGLSGSAQADYLWVVDPLDGTKAYINGIPGFSVMIGLLHKGIPHAGIVIDPWEGHIYEAFRGLGTYHELKGRRSRVAVSRRREWVEMPVITSVGFPEALQTALARSFTGPWLQPVHSVGIKVGFMVRQLADLYINHHAVHLWDTCAPQIILEEAGGVITLVDGQPLSYPLGGDHSHPQATLASNGLRHEEALRALRGARPL